MKFNPKEKEIFKKNICRLSLFEIYLLKFECPESNNALYQVYMISAMLFLVEEVHNDQSLQTVVQPDDRQNEISVEMLNLNKLLFILVAKQVYKESSFSRHLPPCQANFQARASSTSEYTKVKDQQRNENGQTFTTENWFCNFPIKNRRSQLGYGGEVSGLPRNSSLHEIQRDNWEPESGHRSCLADFHGKEGVSAGLEEPGSDENHRNTGSDGQQSDENGYEGK